MNGAVGRRVYGLRSTERTANAAPVERVGERRAPSPRRAARRPASVSVPSRAKSRPWATLWPSTAASRAVNSAEATNVPTMSQYSAATNAIRSRSRSTTSRVATDCTRPGREALHHLPPEHRRDLVAVEPVEDPPRLLRVDEAVVDLARLARARARSRRFVISWKTIRRTGTFGFSTCDEVPGDRLALAVLVRREQELVGVLELRAQARDDLLLLRVDDVERLEVGVDVDAEARPRLLLLRRRHLGGAVRQVADVADRRLDDVVRRRGSRRSSSPWRATRRSRGGARRMALLLAISARHDSRSGGFRDTRPR